MNDAASTAVQAETSAGLPIEGHRSSTIHGRSKASLTGLGLAALGVVFGDIGTSPLYAFREALGQAAADGLQADEILGVLSLALWSQTRPRSILSRPTLPACSAMARSRIRPGESAA